MDLNKQVTGLDISDIELTGANVTSFTADIVKKNRYRFSFLPEASANNVDLIIRAGVMKDNVGHESPMFSKTVSI